jgi:hypothetical protein
VAAGEDRAQNLFDDFCLTDHHPAELVDHLAARLTELREVIADAVL